MAKVIKIRGSEDIYYLGRKFGLPAYIIAKANGIENIRQGMRILIPEMRGEAYIVKPYETLESIAMDYEMNPAKLSANNYGITEVYLGQLIYIP